MGKKVVVALIYDFDGTLSAGNMQEYDFIPMVKKSSKTFWDESTKLAKDQDADPILTYMYRMLHEAKSVGLSLSRETFMESGANIPFFEGVREWFGRINEYGEKLGVKIEHYINSSGLEEMILGTPIAKEFKKIYACRFLYDVDGVAYWPAVAVNYTNKTQFMFKISKGIESVYDSERVNQLVPDHERAVSFKHMVYFGDGLTDIPCMRLVKEQGGHSIAVYKADSPMGKRASEKLVKDKRVSYVCPADYREGSKMDEVVKRIIEKIKSDIELSRLSEDAGTP